MRIFSNTAMSADGKIGTFGYEHAAFGSDEDLRTMSVLRAQADAVLVGGQTFRNWPIPLVESAEHLDAPATGRRPIWNAVLTRRGVLDGENRERLTRRWPDPRTRLLVLGGPELDVAEHERAFGAEALVHPSPSPAWAIAELRARGCENILVEAGGDVIFQLIEADLLDEIFLTVCPMIIGGRGAPTLVDGRGFTMEQIRRLTLMETRRVGDELFLHYIVGSRAVAG